MRVLIDTHCFLWWIVNDPRLSAKAREIISDGNNEIIFSAASSWEIAIKAQLGKLPLPTKPSLFIAEQLLLNGFVTMPVQVSHSLHVFELPRLHRDPFDRLLVAQCQLEQLPILTADPQIKQYSLTNLW